jgi:hypothetical protein
MSATSPNLKFLRHWLLDADYTPILEIAENKKSVLSQLTALTYEEDTKISNNAIRASGLAARIISGRDPEYVRNYLLRLFWLLNDESGGIGWRAPELIGEILHCCPQFNQFFPLLISLLDLEREDAPRFRAGTLWAIGRVAQVAKDEMKPALPWIKNILSSEEVTDIEVRDKALWCIEQITGEKSY